MERVVGRRDRSCDIGRGAELETRVNFSVRGGGDNVGDDGQICVWEPRKGVCDTVLVARQVTDLGVEL